MAEKIDILYIAHIDTSVSSGQAIHTVNAVRSLRKLGIRVIYIGPRFGGTVNALLGCADNILFRLPNVPGLKQIGLQFLGYHHVSRSIRRSRPKIAYIRFNLATFASVIACLLKKTPFALEMNNYTPRVFELERTRLFIPRIFQVLFMRWEKYLVGKASALYCDTEYLRGRLSEDYRLPPNKVIVNANGVDLDRYREKTVRSNPTPVIGFAGHLKTWQGLEYLIRAAEILTADGLEAKYMIIGEGPLRGRLEDLVNATGLGGRFEFTGEIATDRVQAFINRFDVGVAPYIASVDGSALKIFEYMASAVPVVASAISGVKEVLAEAQVGISVPPENPEELARAIKTLLSDAGMRNGYGENGRRLAFERYSWDANARRIIAGLSDNGIRV